MKHGLEPVNPLRLHLVDHTCRPCREIVAVSGLMTSGPCPETKRAKGTHLHPREKTEDVYSVGERNKIYAQPDTMSTEKLN